MTPKHPIPRTTENLYALLDKKFNTEYPNQTFWREFHEIDKELTPGCIRMENFAGNSNHAESNVAFTPGAPTLVMQLKTENAVHNAVRVLKSFFRGTGVEFIPEIDVKDGQHVCQIRSNIDKPQWSKLAVFCKYRFAKEIPSSEQETLRTECQQQVDNYLKGTDVKWNATIGMPAFCSLMGLHGVLRPLEKHRPDARRKAIEMNKVRASGVPAIFRDIDIHVDINKDGIIEATNYKMGYDPNRAAIAACVEGGELLSIAKEAFGYNFFSKDLPIANKFLHAGVAAVSAVALTEGRMEPIIIAAIGGAGLVVGFVQRRWQIIGQLNELKKNTHLLVEAFNKPDSVNLKDGSTENPQAIIDEAYSEGNMAALKELLEAHAIRHLAFQSSGRVVDHLAARATAQTFRL